MFIGGLLGEVSVEKQRLTAKGANVTASWIRFDRVMPVLHCFHLGNRAALSAALHATPNEMRLNRGHLQIVFFNKEIVQRQSARDTLPARPPPPFARHFPKFPDEPFLILVHRECCSRAHATAHGHFGAPR